MSLYNEWLPAEATIEIMGELRHLRAPSKVSLFGMLGHNADPGNANFMRNASSVKPINYVVDVGACVGGVSLMFHQAFPDAKILAIEPVEVNYECLAYNTKRFPKIRPLKMAAHSKKGEIRIAMPTEEQRPDCHPGFGNSGLFTIYGQDHAHSEVVPADTLDNIVDGTVDLLKIDVEGAELVVLSGAKRILTKDRPIIIAEIRPSNIEMSGSTVEQHRDWFKEIGYKLVAKYLGDYVLCPQELSADLWRLKGRDE